MATAIPYKPYFIKSEGNPKLGLSGINTCKVNDIAKSIYPTSAIFVDFKGDGLDDSTNLDKRETLRNELKTYYRNELMTCNHISGFRSWITTEEYPLVKSYLYSATDSFPQVPLGACFFNDSAKATLVSNTVLSYDCAPRIILDNGGYNNYTDPSSDSLRIIVTRTGRRAKLDLISGRLDVRPAGVIHDSLSIRQRGGSPVSLEKATGTSFLQSIESNTNLPVTMRLYATDGIADAGFIYKLSCRNLNDPIIRSIDKTVAFESCTLKVFGFNLDSCTFGLSLHTFRAPDSVAADGTWAKFILPSYNTYTSPVLESTSIFDGSFVYARSLRSGLIVHSPEKLLLRRGRIRINAPTWSLCEPKKLRVDTTEKLLFSEADPNLSRKPYYRWYRLTHGTVSSVSGDVVTCPNCFPSDGRSNQYLLIDKVGEFRIRRRLNASSVLLYPTDIPISGPALVGHKVSVGGNERLEGSTATVTSPGTYWCYDANLGFAGSNSGISCPLIPDTIAVSESDVVECGLLFTKNSMGKQTSTVETGKLNLKDSAFTFEMLLMHDGAGARWDTVSTYKWGTDSSIVNLNSAMRIFTDRNGHLAVKLFNGTIYRQLITRDPLVPKNSYHVAVVRKDSDSLFFFVTPVSSLTSSLPIGYSSLWVDSLPYNTSQIRIKQSEFFRAGQGMKIERSSTLNFNNHFFLQFFGQDSLTQLRAVRLWRGARTEAQIKADGLRVLSGEDGGSDNMRQVFDYRFLAKAGDSVLQTTPLDPDLVLHYGRSKEPSLSPSSCGMAHPSAALAGPDMYPPSSDTIHLASATLNPPSGTWQPTNAVTSTGIFSPSQGRAGDNFIRYNIPTSGTGTARVGCNTAIPLFRRIQLPGQITSPGDSGLTPYPWKLYSYKADCGSLNRDSLSFIWEAKQFGGKWDLVDSGQHSTLRYAWVFKSVLDDSLRVRIRVRSGGRIGYFIRKLVVKPRYMVEIFGLQSSDTVAATFNSLRIDSIEAQMEYPSGQIHNKLPQAILNACGGGGIRACIRLRWLLSNGSEQIRDVSSELVGTDSGVPMLTTVNNQLRPGVYAYTRIRSILTGSLPLSLQFTFDRASANNYYNEYTLPISVLVKPKAADTLHPLIVGATCVNSKAILIADSLRAGTTLWASPSGKSYLDSTWASGGYQAYGVVNGRCRATTFGVFNGGDMATILKDTTLAGTTFVLKDVSVYEGALTLAPKARVYMVAGAFPSNVHFIKDSVKMLDLRFGDWSTLELSPGSVIQGVCNMWGGIRFYRRAFLKKFSGADKPLIADAYRGLWYTDEVAEGPVLSARTSHDSLDMIPALYVRGLRFERNRVAIDDQIGIAHFGTVDSCEFVGNMNMLPPLKNSPGNDYYGFKAISIAQRDVQILVRQNHFRHYQFGVVEQGKLTSSIGEHGPDITVDTSRFDSCGFAAIYSRYSRVQVARSLFKFGPQVGYGSSIYEKQAGDPFDPAYHTELDFYQRPIGVYIDSTNRQRLAVNNSGFEGCRDSSRFSGLTGTGISVSKSQVILSDSKLRRLKVGVRMMRIPPEGYQSVSGSHFWACQNGIYAGVNGLWQNTDLELTCSSFEPGDTLPDYSGSTPHFSRQLSGAAVGIKAEAKGLKEIGRLVLGSDPRAFSPGVNVFPLGTSVNRRINPSATGNVNEPGSSWHSPTGWRAIKYVGSIFPKYHRFRNEFVGDSILAITNDTASIVFSDVKDAHIPDCGLSSDSNLFPTKRSGRTIVAGNQERVSNRIILEASPNPVEGRVEIHYHLPSAAKASLELLSFTGSLPIDRKIVSKQDGYEDFNLSDQPPGVYLVRLMQSGQVPVQIRLVRIK
ncbi:T9SS type A sorting domain-containing protein [Nostoc sp. NIES-2111]